MSLPLWSRYDAQVYRALSTFPEELEGKFLSPDEFKGNFKDFNGRPMQDIVEALNRYGEPRYGERQYFKFEIMLTAAYLKQGQALAQVEAAFSTLRPKPDTPPDTRRGLSGPVYDKVLAEQPLTVSEARSLPDDARPYLVFKLMAIDRVQLREDLIIYESSTQPSRLMKANSNERSGPTPAVAKLPPLNIKELILKPESYDKQTGILHLVPYHDRKIVGKAGVKRPNGKKYEQCRVMECVFKTNKSLKYGVEISSILGISKSAVDKTTTRKIGNARTEINKKVADRGGPKNLIKMQNGKVFLNNSYL